jgi:hypothetical protein
MKTIGKKKEMFRSHFQGRERERVLDLIFGFLFLYEWVKIMDENKEMFHSYYQEHRV